MSEVKFRSSFNGFNRSDVVNFISTQSDKHKAEIANKDMQITELENRAEDSARKLDEYTASVRELVEKSQSELRICNEIMVILRDSFDYSAELKKLSKINDELVGQLCRGYLSKSMELCEAEKYREKANKYDSITGLLTNSEIAASDKHSELTTDENAIQNEMLSGVDMKGFDIKTLSGRQEELLDSIIAALSEANQKLEKNTD